MDIFFYFLNVKKLKINSIDGTNFFFLLFFFGRLVGLPPTPFFTNRNTSPVPTCSSLRSHGGPPTHLHYPAAHGPTIAAWMTSVSGGCHFFLEGKTKRDQIELFRNTFHFSRHQCQSNPKSKYEISVSIVYKKISR